PSCHRLLYWWPSRWRVPKRQREIGPQNRLSFPRSASCWGRPTPGPFACSTTSPDCWRPPRPIAGRHPAPPARSPGRHCRFAAPSAEFHSRIVLSSEPETRVLPSGKSTRPVTLAVWPVNILVTVPPARFHSLISPLAWPVADQAPSPATTTAPAASLAPARSF